MAEDNNKRTHGDGSRRRGCWPGVGVHHVKVALEDIAPFRAFLRQLNDGELTVMFIENP